MRHFVVVTPALLLLLLTSARVEAQTRIITGRVVDSLTGDPVTSGQVSAQGTTVGTTLKDDGTFTLVLPGRDVVLTIRSIGFKRRDIPVPASENSVRGSLERDYFQLEAIVVTGQATGVERRNLANAVATVGSDQLVKAPTASVEQSLQGKLAGAQITQNSGAPGGGILVRLRGVTSINSSYTPLYVVDGVIVSDLATPPGTNFVTQANPGTQLTTTQENQVNRIADLNPNDIETVEVLKGASAAAIYGSKAASGVIIITTRKGRTGTPQFSLTQRFGLSHMSRQIGSRTYTSAAEALAQLGPGADVDFNAAGGQVFDHERELAGGTPLSYESGLSVNGGSETSRYFASGMVKKDGGIVTGTFYDKQSLRLNLDQDLGRRISFSIGSGLNHSLSDRGLVNNENNGTSYWSAFSTTPSFFDIRATCPDGSRQVRCENGIYPINRYASSNPLQSANEFQNRENVWRFIGTGRLNFDAINATQHVLKLMGNGGIDFFSQRNGIFSPPDLQFERIDGLLGTSAVSYTQNLNANVNGNLVYTFKTGRTSATTQVGMQYQTRQLNIDRTLGANLVGGLQIPQAATTVIVENRIERIRDMGVFAQEEFLTLGEHLLLTAAIRADQSSANADAKKLYYYPKASGSYRFAVAKGLVDELKFRAAFGQSGNQPEYGLKFTELAPTNIGGTAASRIQITTSADDVRPERQREIEGGFDATLFGGRGNLEATVYQKEVTDLILRRSLATSVGFTTQIFNGGTLRNRGLELGLNLVPVQRPSLQWNARVNFALNRCVVTALPVPTFINGGTTFGAVKTEVGKSCTSVVSNDTLGRLPGDAALGAIGSSLVREVRDQAPGYTMGWSNDIAIKRLKLYFLWDYQHGGALANLTTILYDFAGNSKDQTAARKPGATDTPAGLSGNDRVAQFAREGRVFIEDGSYLKLREVSLSIELPQSLRQKFWSGSRYIRFSLTGRNLLTFTPYIGTEPENNQVPGSLARSRSWDLWAYPPSRSYWLSVDLGF